MPVFIDQLQRKVEITSHPKRIISLVPSQTELLFDLGLEHEVVGITRFCVHPQQWFKSKTRVGGTKKLNFELIAKLNPDLIIANKEENTEVEIYALENRYPVWISDIKTLDDAIKMINEIGMLTGHLEQANTISSGISTAFNEFIQTLNSGTKKVAYFIWNNPMMVAGSDTFINEMLNICNLKNVFNNAQNFNEQKQSYRYPEITETELITAQPELILLSSEPFPFKEKHIQQFKAICPDAEIKIVDGELFSWYGSRLRSAPAYFKTLMK